MTRVADIIKRFQTLPPDFEIVDWFWTEEDIEMAHENVSDGDPDFPKLDKAFVKRVTEHLMLTVEGDHGINWDEINDAVYYIAEQLKKESEPTWADTNISQEESKS